MNGWDFLFHDGSSTIPLIFLIDDTIPYTNTYIYHLENSMDQINIRKIMKWWYWKNRVLHHGYWTKKPSIYRSSQKPSEVRDRRIMAYSSVMEVSSEFGGTPKFRTLDAFKKGKSYGKKMMMTGGTPISGNHHIHMMYHWEVTLVFVDTIPIICMLISIIVIYWSWLNDLIMNMKKNNDKGIIQNVCDVLKNGK